MKKILFVMLAFMSTACSVSMEAMSNSRMREETRFLTDKMAYELSLNTRQYNDVYEINYDFISKVRYLMDDVIRGEEWALNRYYDCLDVRNDDLRWVLSYSQYRRFIHTDYFFRPIYASAGSWHFRVYITYSNHGLFYFPRPYHYYTYKGNHYRTRYAGVSYYKGQYDHPFYNGSYHIRNHRSFVTYRRSDFGSMRNRIEPERRPSRDDVYTIRHSSSNRSKSERMNENNRASDNRNNKEDKSVSRTSHSTDSKNVRSGYKVRTSSNVRSTESTRQSENSSSSKRSTSASSRSKYYSRER
ncbi:MAG: hypothetical protein LKI39_13705 [Bacteroides sp.]|jgi:hypothetical protein|nr:hypothetical protein [Bacteroides sp.]MCI1683594.1 hypothetical protein [Bacteroides sp.]